MGCAAYGCTNRQDRDRKNGITFHKFPHRDPKRLRQWIINTKRAKWTPVGSTVLCSSHFEAGYFDRTGQTVRLRENAVPTIFNFPAHLMKKKSSRKPPSRRVTSEKENHPSSDVKSSSSSSISSSSSNSSSSALSNLSAITLREHSYSVMESPRKLKRKMDAMLEELQCCHKKLKIAQQKSRRLGKKVTSLKGLVRNLRGRNRIPKHCSIEVSVYDGDSDTS